MRMVQTSVSSHTNDGEILIFLMTTRKVFKEYWAHKLRPVLL